MPRHPEVLDSDYPFLKNAFLLDRMTRAREAEVNEHYYNGDTWRFWIGPLPKDTSPEAFDVLVELRRVFQRSNKVKECIDRHVAGMVGNPFHWYLVDEQGERAEAPPAETALQRWLDHIAQSCIENGNDDSSDPVQDAVRFLSVMGRAYLRIWMPARAADDPDPVKRVYLHAPHPTSVEVERDEEGFISKITYRNGQIKEVQERNEAGVLIVSTYEEENLIDRVALPQLGGHWTIYELKARPLISDDVRDAQNGINLAKTMQSRTLIENGFVERVITNGQMPGGWIDDPTAANGKRFVPTPGGFKMGPGRTNLIQGSPVYDDFGKVKGYATPGVNWKDPAPVDTFQASIAGDTAQIYLAMGQGHLLSQDMEISGVSRQQLRQDAEVKAVQQEKVITYALRGILGAFLSWIGSAELMPVVQLKKASQMITPEEKQEIITEYREGLLSKATTIAKLGSVDDVDAEMALIEEDRVQLMEEQRQQMEMQQEMQPDEPPVGKGGE